MQNYLFTIEYTGSVSGFGADSIAVLTALKSQSLDTALGVDCDYAGDQGMMFGYAMNETDRTTDIIMAA